jgi:hypothetical protein
MFQLNADIQLSGPCSLGVHHTTVSELSGEKLQATIPPLFRTGGVQRRADSFAILPSLERCCDGYCLRIKSVSAQQAFHGGLAKPLEDTSRLCLLTLCITIDDVSLLLEFVHFAMLT